VGALKCSTFWFPSCWHINVWSLCQIITLLLLFSIYDDLECCGVVFVRLDREHFFSLRDNEPFQSQQQSRHDNLGSLGAYNHVNPNLAKCGSPEERGATIETLMKMDPP
jgi:hypothetical protein